MKAKIDGRSITIYGDPDELARKAKKGITVNNVTYKPIGGIVKLIKAIMFYFK